MQFKVPQFIDIEDKIFGPFTFKQFVYLVGGAGICYVALKLLPILFAVPVVLIVAPLSLALVFYRVNEKPFEYILRAYIVYFFQSKLYVWKKIESKNKTEVKNNQEEQNKDIISVQPRLSGSKLKDLAWSLDVLDMNNQGK
jgi:hypothetical protein